jgi:YegS/Rv2252/BmrU family lipid kinase
MTAQETLLVLNPASAGGRTLRRWPALATAMRREGIGFDLHHTTGPGDATRVVRDALRAGVGRVVAVGGDGTLNEVVNGFFDESGDPLGREAALGLVPSGTGGDFRRSAGIPNDPAACARVLGGGRLRRIDAGRIDFGSGATRFFVNIADCGIGGEVVAAVNASRHKAGGARGSAVFLGISLRALLTYPGRRVRLAFDGAEPELRTVQSVVVANGRYFGGGMHIAPGALLDDMLFDVVVVERAGRLRSVAAVPSLYRGTHLRNPSVTVTRATELRIESADGQELPFDVEGEQVGTTPATLRCLPGAIRLCVG